MGCSEENREGMNRTTADILLFVIDYKISTSTIPPFGVIGLRLGRSVGRPSLYPPGVEMIALRVPKAHKERLQQVGIALAWGRLEEAIELIKSL